MAGYNLGPDQAINVLLGLVIASGVGGIVYYIVNTANSTAAQKFMDPVAKNWGTVVTLVGLGVVFLFLMPAFVSFARGRIGE